VGGEEEGARTDQGSLAGLGGALGQDWWKLGLGPGSRREGLTGVWGGRIGQGRQRRQVDGRWQWAAQAARAKSCSGRNGRNGRDWDNQPVTGRSRKAGNRKPCRSGRQGRGETQGEDGPGRWVGGAGGNGS